MCYMLGNKYLMDGKLEKALSEYASCLEKRPDSGEALFLSFLCASLIGDDRKAGEFLSRIANLPFAEMVVEIPVLPGSVSPGHVEEVLARPSPLLSFSLEGRRVRIIKRSIKEESR